MLHPQQRPLEATELTSPSPGAPASHPAGGVDCKGRAVVHADGLDVVVERGPALQQQHRHVGGGHVAHCDVGHVQPHLEGVGAVLVQAPQDHGPVGRHGGAGGKEGESDLATPAHLGDSVAQQRPLCGPHYNVG